MDSLQSKFEAHYAPLWNDFIEQIKGVNVENCPEPHLPVYGESYNNSDYKIAFVGVDAAESCSMADYNSEDGYIQIIQHWKQNHFDELEYCDWAWKWNFWRFIFQFLAKFYNISVKEIKKCESKTSQNILKSFVWANVMSIERFHVTAQGKGVKYEDWKVVKDASFCLDRAENIIQVFEPKIIILLNWTCVPDEWFPSELEEPVKDPTIPLWYYYIKKTDTHLYWTKHPRSLTSIGYNIIITKILQSVMQNKIFTNFPWQKNYELMEDFIEQLKKTAQELNLKITIDDNLGDNETGFYFFQKAWKYCNIGFAFEEESFFYGICRKDMSQSIPEITSETIKEKFGLCDDYGPTQYWPWWKWHEERYWNTNKFTQNQIVELNNKIKSQIEAILDALNGIEL